MGGGGDRNGILGGLETQLQATPEDRGELPLKPIFANRAHIQPEMIDTLVLHAACQSTADLVPRRQISTAKVRDRTMSMGIDQSSALSSNSLTDQEVRSAWQH
jgi:hypothetical protein